ncbi:probable cationic amino acid transporter isoform X1 [Dermacentor albipictus]|uniref:probable cationic amino acid transporter isoform X1 n=2 Tax=Dermacentor albipictus TaxID=60249 RepID=UPI0031FC350E
MFTFSKPSFLTLVARLVRTKDPASDITESKTELKRCLTTLDLTSLGVGSCVGTGMYLVAGMVARNFAGPGVIFSFIIAAIASLFSGVCYAEFGVRVPHTSGSAYMYSYVTVGEFVAFVIGWNMILEYLIGSAAGACAISACIDAMLGGAINEAFRNTFGTIIGHTPDLLAGIITVLMSALMLAGVKKSLLFNNVLNCLNFAVWVFIMGAGLFYIDTDNWTKHGGFLPYGWSGVLAGAATCFYAFIGFDIIATTGEEAENPKVAIPTAIIFSLAIVLTAYITSSMMVTLIVPYSQINAGAGLVEMFAQRGARSCHYIVALGALAGLVVSMLGSMFPMPRVVYAMAKDGLIFRALSKVWPVTETPAFATLLLGGATAVVSIVMSLDVLVEMMSIGTLMAYTLVSTCVLLLRYQPRTKTLVELLPESVRSQCPTPSSEAPPSMVPSLRGLGLGSTGPPLGASTTTIRTKRTNRVVTPDSDDDERRGGGDGSLHVLQQEGYGSMLAAQESIEEDMFQQPTWWETKTKQLGYLLPFLRGHPGPATDSSGMKVMKLVGLLYVFAIAFDLVIVCGVGALERGNWFVLVFLFACLAGILASVFLIAKEPQAKCDLKFKAPGVPVVPAIAVVVNIYLIFKLSVLTLVRFIVWMVLGMIMYFCYGIKKSNLESLMEERIELKIPTQGFTLEAPPAPPQQRQQQQPPTAEEISAKLADVANGRPPPAPPRPYEPQEDEVPARRWHTFE